MQASSHWTTAANPLIRRTLPESSAIQTSKVTTSPAGTCKYWAVCCTQPHTCWWHISQVQCKLWENHPWVYVHQSNSTNSRLCYLPNSTHDSHAESRSTYDLEGQSRSSQYYAPTSGVTCKDSDVLEAGIDNRKGYDPIYTSNTSSVDRDVTGGPVGCNWLRQWFQMFILSFTFTFR